jgi:hypothetical protein
VPIIISGGGGGGGGTVTTARTFGNNGANFTTTSASFVDLTSATVTIAAVTGDVLFYTCSMTLTINASLTTPFIALVTTTGANNIESGMQPGVPSSGINTTCTIATQYVVVPGDISAGNVAAKVRVASNGTNTLTVFNSGSVVWRLSVANFGH